MCDVLYYILDSAFIRFDSKSYSQFKSIPMGTNGATLVVYLLLFCYESHVVFSDNNQTDVIEADISTSRYLDDLINFDNLYFEQMVG